MRTKYSKYFVIITHQWGGTQNCQRTVHFHLEAIGEPTEEEVYEQAYKLAAEATNEKIRDEKLPIPLIDGDNFDAVTLFYRAVKEDK